MKNVNEIANNYRKKIEQEGVNTSFLQYVEEEAKNDPSFFRYLFEEDFENDFDRDLSEEQREQYNDFIEEVANHTYEKAFYCTSLEKFAELINKEDEWNFTLQEIVMSRNPEWEEEDEYETDICRHGDMVLEIAETGGAEVIHRPR